MKNVYTAVIKKDKKFPAKEKYICRIHDTKPKHCRDYPKSKKHALQTGCKGFD